MKRKKRGCLSRIVLLCLLVLALGVFWWYGNQTIDTEKIEITSARLPDAFDGFRALVISDLHGKSWGENSARLLDEAAQAEPDIICICGDMVDSTDDISVLPSLLDGLVKIAPCFYVTGNHEWVTDNMDEVMELLESCGVTRLANEYRTLTIDGQTIVLGGVDDPNGPYDMKTPGQLVEEIRTEQGEDSYIFMLAHRNNQIDMWSELGVDAVVCGHGHGGIIRIPFVGGLIGVDRNLFPKYTSGLYTEGETSMIVSRGLGTSVVNLRIFNRPHMPLVILRASNQ